MIRSNNDSVHLALKTFHELAISSDSKYALSQYYLLNGTYLKNLGKFGEAIAQYRMAIHVENDSLSSFSIDQINRIAICFKNLGMLDSSYFHYNKAAQLGLKSNYQKGRGDAYSGIGQILELKGMYAQSITYYMKSLDAFVAASDSTGISVSYNNVGNIMYYQGNYNQALEYYKKSAFIDYQRNNTLNLAMAYGNIGMIYHETNHLDSSLFYNTLCMKLLEDINQNLFLGTIYNNIALLYKDMDQTKLSLEFHFKSKTIKEEIGDVLGLATSLINIGNLMVADGRFSESIPYYKEGFSIVAISESPELLMKGYEGYAKALVETGNYKEAYFSLQNYIAIKDSIEAVEVRNEVNAIEIQFESKQKDALIEQQSLSHQQELALKEAEQRTMRIISVAIISLFIITAAFMLIFYKKLKVTRQQKSLIEAKNRENELLLGEIHHRVKNNLQVISSLLSLQEKMLSDAEAKKAIFEGKERVKSMGLIHKLLYQNDNFAGVEMNTYLLQLIDGLMDSFGIQKDGIEIDINAQALNLDVDSAVPIGLIINELIVNSFKYAVHKVERPKMTIEFLQSNDGLILNISDNGEGNPDEINESTSFGSRLVKSLVRQLNGELQLTRNNGLCYSILIRDFKLIS